MKFLTGHYVQVTQSKDTDQVAAALSEIEDIPDMAGVMRRYSWSDIEGGKDEWLFGRIQNDLDRLAAKGKKLVMFIQYKYKNESGNSVVPSYMDALTGGNAAYTLNSLVGDRYANGYLAKFSNDIVVERFIALMNALRRFDSHPALAAILFVETAMGVDLPAAEVDRYFQGLMRAQRASACLFRQTPVIQLTNFPRRLLPALTENYKRYGVGMGGPDIWLNDESISSPGGAFTFYPELERSLPVGVIGATQNFEYNSHEDFKNNIKNNLTPAQAIQQMATYARDKLYANYIFWKRDWAGDDYYKELLKQAKEHTLPVLDSDCPTSINCRR